MGAAEDLAARFRPIFGEIGGDSASRDRTRTGPFNAVRQLRDAGFGALRIPVADGGAGASLRQLFGLLTELAEADPNLPQILRAHFAFVEGRLAEPDAKKRVVWLQRVVDGAIFGAAMAERTAGTETTTILTRRGDGWVLDGEKYYSTGTLYASWIVAVAKDGGDRLVLAVPADARGVSVEDDWDGFGQRTTGSGTTRFDGVRLDDANIIRRAGESELPSETYLTAFYQLFHLAALAGIVRAVKRDAISFVRERTRTFGVPGRSDPRHDPLVQRVVGRLSAIAFTADALVEKLAGQLDDLYDSRGVGAIDPQRYVEADIAAFEAQQTAIDLALQATTLLFEVGGASAVSERLGLDRHWRNARVLASHNPAIQRERAIGDFHLNGTNPGDVWRNGFAATSNPKPDARHA